MVNSKDQLIARLDERTKNMVESLDEIKKQLERIKGCVDGVERKSNTTEQCLKDHLKSHDVGRSWIQWVPSLIAVAISAVSLIVAFS